MSEKSMRIALACDHGGYPLKSAIKECILADGYPVLDLGTDGIESVDYPDFAEKLGLAIINGEAERGILICGSGVGACIAVNKIKGVYAGLCHDTYSAHQGVEHDNMNVLCLGARVIGNELAKELVDAFLRARFSNEERHVRRLNKVYEIEKAGY
jgi:ribose 5-phosphate isomerase B